MFLNQQAKQKKAEIVYRRKLVLQHEGKKIYFATASSSDEILDCLKTRIRESKKIFSDLSKKFSLVPFLEIGAEKCQRSALLQSEFGIKGIALDISFDSLNAAENFIPKLGLKKMPQRVCADAYHLPFKDESFSFVFCFQTLHHFPHPLPVMSEIKRVLKKGGIFYFAEEPIKQKLNFNLWRRDFHLRKWEKILKWLLILPFLSTIGKSEVESGILEESFNLKVWEESLNIFPKAWVKLEPYPFGPALELEKSADEARWLKTPFIADLFLKVLGGGITALARNQGKMNEGKKNLNDIFACPNCKADINFSPIQKHEIICQRCEQHYPIKNGIIIAIPTLLRKRLYGARF